MKTIYPRIYNINIYNEIKILVGNVANVLRNSSGDNILNAQGEIRSFIKKTKFKKQEIIDSLEQNKEDFSYISELHVQRISWIKEEIKLINL